MGKTAYTTNDFNALTDVLNVDGVNRVTGILQGQAYSRTAVGDTAYAILRSDFIVAYGTTTAGRTATLPTAVGFAGQTYVLKDEAGTAATRNLTLATTSAQTIDGASTKVISANFGSIRVYSDGANWFTY